MKEIIKEYEAAEQILLPKGDNSKFLPSVGKILGFDIPPKSSGRCLHDNQSRQRVWLV